MIRALLPHDCGIFLGRYCMILVIVWPFWSTTQLTNADATPQPGRGSRTLVKFRVRDAELASRLAVGDLEVQLQERMRLMSPVATGVFDAAGARAVEITLPRLGGRSRGAHWRLQEREVSGDRELV